MNHQAAPLFANNWNVYQKIIFKNYMLHWEFGAATRQVIENMGTLEPLTVLDMGCGDAHQIAQVLEGIQVAKYVGYDLAAPALKVASENMSNYAEQVHLKQGKMEVLIKEETEAFDLVYTSYALHHLDDDSKISFLKNCHDRLKPNGRFIHIDVARKTGQSREAYIANYMNHIKQEWTLLNAEEINLIEEHIHQCDFPAEIDSLKKWLESTGFTIENHLEGDGRHSLLVLKKR